jgi:hypothetical protein
VLNIIVAGLWPYLKSQFESLVKDSLREPLGFGGASVVLERVDFGGTCPLLFEGACCLLVVGLLASHRWDRSMLVQARCVD